jgi:hypothetical protein
MNNFLVKLAGGVMMMSITTLSAAEFFVSPNGRDSNPGSEVKPFATMDAARDAIRRLPPDAKSRGVTVWIGSGSYMLNNTFELDARDSGIEGAPIVYRAEKDAKVTLLGGIFISPEAFTPVKDQAMIERLDESARGKVLQFALPKQGTTEAGEKVLPVRNELVNGSMFSMRLPVPELFFNGEELPFSKWPNTGFAKYGKVIDAGSVPRFGDKSNRPGTFEYTDTRPDRWTKAEHIYIHGYFAEDWFDDVLKVGNLDIQQRRMTFTTPHMYGLKPNKSYRALGLLEEIDQPGEWMVDHEAGILYLNPPADMAKGQFALSMLKTPMIRMKQTQHVTFRDLNLEVTQGTCVDIAGGTDNLIAGCTIRNVGGCGILIRPVDQEVKDPGGLHQFRKESGAPLKDGRRNGVVGCTLYNIGTTGISMLGGDRETLAPSKHYAVNNDIYHYARRQRANQPAINMNGVGQRAAHNFIHDAPHVGLDYSGNDHLVEYNELTRLCLETGDVGAIYSGRNWTYRGNVVRHNYIHHIQGPGKHGSMAVYLDDSCSSTHIYGNVFYKVQRAAFIGGGRDNAVENNIFVDVSLAVHLDNRSEGWANKYQKLGGDHRMYEKLKEVNHDKPPYSTRYPELTRIHDETPHKPLGNKVLNNICVRSKWTGGGAEKHLQIGDNLVTQEDPGFVDAANLNFKLKDDSVVFRQLPNFKPIPFEKIGLYNDEYRKVERSN